MMEWTASPCAVACVGLLDLVLMIDELLHRGEQLVLLRNIFSLPV